MYSILNKLSEDIYTFTYQKTLLHTLLLLSFKIVESLQRIFKHLSFNVNFKHGHKQQIVWKCGPNWLFYAFMLRTKLY